MAPILQVAEPEPLNIVIRRMMFDGAIGEGVMYISDWRFLGKGKSNFLDLLSDAKVEDRFLVDLELLVGHETGHVFHKIINPLHYEQVKHENELTANIDLSTKKHDRLIELQEIVADYLAYFYFDFNGGLARMSGGRYMRKDSTGALSIYQKTNRDDSKTFLNRVMRASILEATNIPGIRERLKRLERIMAKNPEDYLD